MRNTHTGAGICLAVGLLALATPAAVAADPAGEQTIHISPRSASPGSLVTVSTRACGKETYGKGTSEAAGAFHLFEGERKGVLVGEFEVPDDAKPDTDTVTVKCPPRIQMTDTYRVADRTPSGGVAAGFSVPVNHGAQLAVGSVLLAGAAAGAVFKMRSRAASARD